MERSRRERRQCQRRRASVLVCWRRRFQSAIPAASVCPFFLKNFIALLPLALTYTFFDFSYLAFPVIVFSPHSYQREVVEAYLQTADLPPESSFIKSNRAYPDVTALAWGVPMFVNGTELTTGGTSASAPAFAGVVSLLNGRRLNAGLPVLGFLQPRLYQAAAASARGTRKLRRSGAGSETPMFKDIVFGNSSVGGDHYDCGNGFVAQAGWDAITGWGSPRWGGLVDSLVSD